MKPIQTNSLSSSWALLGVFLLMNGLLSYVPLPLGSRLILMALLGLLFFMGLRLDRPQQPSPNNFHPPLWVWITFGFLALILRFGMLTRFEGWPGGDDSLQGLFAIDLNRHWTWRMFYTTGQHPPLWIWFLSLFFRLSPNSAFNLWFPPALVSLLFVLISTLAVGRLFDRGTALFFFCAVSFGFWPLYFGRFCVQADFVPLFEALTFLCLAGLWTAQVGAVQWGWAIGLGLCVGLGTYSYTGFISVLLGVSLGLLIWAWGKKERGLPIILYFTVLLIFLFPLVDAVLIEHVGGYIWGVSPLGGLYHWKDQFFNAASYITALFWGPLGGSADYGPVWGGFLNPVESAFFLLGLGVIREWKGSSTKWLLAGAFFLFLLPGLLTADIVEMLRVIPLMPLLYLVSAVGFFDLWKEAVNLGRKAFLVFLMILSVGMNLYHLAKVRSADGPLTQKFSYQERVNEGYWAYRHLLEAAQTQGPGLVFSDFLPLARDHALHVMSYPFNALLNPSLVSSQAKWAGLLTNVHYGAFLKKRFPDSQWFYVTPPKDPVGGTDDGGSVVGIIPITPENRNTFNRWSKAHDYFNELSVEAENAMNNRELYAQQVAKLPGGYPLMEGDSFLESVYGEWVAQYHLGINLDLNISALERALQKGYPSANLYFKLGNFLAAQNRIPEAEKAFAGAAACPINHTQAAHYLQTLEGRE